jgi:hypothetical protein
VPPSQHTFRERKWLATNEKRTNLSAATSPLPTVACRYGCTAYNSAFSPFVSLCCPGPVPPIVQSSHAQNAPFITGNGGIRVFSFAHAYSGVVGVTMPRVRARVATLYVTESHRMLASIPIAVRCNSRIPIAVRCNGVGGGGGRLIPVKHRAPCSLWVVVARLSGSAASFSSTACTPATVGMSFVGQSVVLTGLCWCVP